MTEGPMQSGTHQEFPCGQCGAKLEFAPGSASLQCPYCGHTQQIGGPVQGQGQAEGQVPVAAAVVEERSFTEALAALRQAPVSALANNGHEIECNGCGAVTVITGQADSCPFCDSPVVIPNEPDRATIVPESVLPFVIDQRAAAEKFKEWVKSRWFAPNDLALKAQRARIDGVYLPYYTYDALASAAYTGQRGEYYYVTETYTDSEGKTQTRQVRKTRWYPASGRVQCSFDDLLVCGSRSLPDKLVQDLEPWDLGALTPYDPRYLSGFMAERAAVTLEEGFGVAKQRMIPTIESTIRNDIGGDTQRIHSYSTQHSNITFKLFFLPLWLSSFRYDKKVFRFVVNARTGEATGERPWSAIKIALAVVGGLALVALIVFLVQYFQ